MAFVKLFSSIMDSTIWQEPDHTRIVWITLMAMADRDGEIAASIPGLAARARVPLAAAEIALGTFLAPDQYSRTEAHEGRRIEKIDGGWRLLNYFKYREARSPDEIREKAAERKRRERERKCHSVTSVTKRDSHGSHAIAEAEAESSIQGTVVSSVVCGIERTEVSPSQKTVRAKNLFAPFKSERQQGLFQEFWNVYPFRVAKPRAIKNYKKQIKTPGEHKAMIAGLYRDMERLLACETGFQPNPGSWLSDRRWEDESLPETRRMSAAERLIASL